MNEQDQSRIHDCNNSELPLNRNSFSLNLITNVSQDLNCVGNILSQEISNNSTSDLRSNIFENLLSGKSANPQLFELNDLIPRKIVNLPRYILILKKLTMINKTLSNLKERCVTEQNVLIRLTNDVLEAQFEIKLIHEKRKSLIFGIDMLNELKVQRQSEFQFEKKMRKFSRYISSRINLNTHPEGQILCERNNWKLMLEVFENKITKYKEICRDFDRHFHIFFVNYACNSKTIDIRHYLLNDVLIDNLESVFEQADEVSSTKEEIAETEHKQRLLENRVKRYNLPTSVLNTIFLHLRLEQESIDLKKQGEILFGYFKTEIDPSISYFLAMQKNVNIFIKFYNELENTCCNNYSISFSSNKSRRAFPYPRRSNIHRKIIFNISPKKSTSLITRVMKRCV